MASLLARRLNPKSLLPHSTARGAFASLFQLNSQPQFEAEHGNPFRSFFRSQSSDPRAPLAGKQLAPIPSPSLLFPRSAGVAIRHFSSDSPANGGAESPSQAPVFKHQEIEGPTVERDLSPLANETREVLSGVRRSVLVLSSSLVLLGFSHLALGASMIYSSQPPEAAMIQGVIAFGLPFSVAFLMRRALKPMSFFQKMEEQGRLQILTLALQVSKSFNLLFLRIHVVSISCVVAMALGSLVTMWPK